MEGEWARTGSCRPIVQRHAQPLQTRMRTGALLLASPDRDSTAAELCPPCRPATCPSREPARPARQTSRPQALAAHSDMLATLAGLLHGSAIASARPASSKAPPPAPESGEGSAAYLPPGDKALAAAVAASGCLPHWVLATGGADGVCRVWDLGAARALASLPAHSVRGQRLPLLPCAKPLLPHAAAFEGKSPSGSDAPQQPAAAAATQTPGWRAIRQAGLPASPSGLRGPCDSLRDGLRPPSTSAAAASRPRPLVRHAAAARHGWRGAAAAASRPVRFGRRAAHRRRWALGRPASDAPGGGGGHAARGQPASLLRALRSYCLSAPRLAALLNREARVAPCLDHREPRAACPAECWLVYTCVCRCASGAR
jgi:hypothetical protein